MSRRNASAPTLLLLAALLTPGCKPATTADPNAHHSRSDPFPRRYATPTGETSSVPAPPQRIVSATLFTDAVLLAICPRARIAALHEVSTKPMFSPVAEESRRFPHHVTADPESVRIMRPDLVFLASFSDKRADALVSGDGCTVVRLHGLSSLAGIRQSIRDVGYLIGCDEAAERVVATMQERLDRVALRRARRRAWRLLSWDSGFVAGKGTVFDDVLACVGARNAAAERGLSGAVRLEQEQLLGLDPDALVVGVAPGDEAGARQRLLQL
ncbi:MAG: ABC transporter substrate-binding protein, partial [Planctomycetes bacterium]|nr:ABC transporter substrate-binding protein [Planctomycetota bacterium]